MAVQMALECFPKWRVALLMSLAIVFIIVQAAPRDQHHRQKRHLLQMCELIVSHTNRSCLDYNNYGCFCGLGMTGGEPVDAIDGCCHEHDLCYGRVRCFWFYPQLVGYQVTCQGDLCTCEDHYLFSPCAHTTCQCDVEFSQCLARYEYNLGFKNYDRLQCAANSPSPTTVLDSV
ncbi:basic phospholipase A2-like isoform X2 [Physella acuta]|nr:basic phospholipase A2-like isoform X2 [Physella acuta]XP_059171131.1 basic phospholipase A2-like isoform X2 [Physella acuta]